jgi:hypothetical protein
LHLLCPQTELCAQSDGEQVAKRFLDHMRAVGPVAGEFEVRCSLDPVVLERRREEMGPLLKQKPVRIELEKDEQFLKCRWAWDGKHEMAEALEGTKNVEGTFYHTQEALLIGMAPKNFNLEESSPIPRWRPASFYLLAGTLPWEVQLSTYSFRVEAAPPGSSPGTVLLIGKRSKPNLEARLLVHETSGSLHRAELDLDGKPYSRLAVEEFVQGPGKRAFPRKARLEVYFPPHFDRPYRQMTLVAKRVSYPRTKEETDQAFALTLPKGTRIADRILNRLVLLDRPRTALEILGSNLPSKAFDLPNEAVTLTLPPERDRTGLWVLGLLLLAGVLLVWVIRRSGRVRAHRIT